MARDWALFLHLSGVLLFVGGSIAVTALRLLAIGKERPSESALLLRAVRPLVPLVGVGLLLTLGAGVWLADELRVPYDSGWLQVDYGLIVWLGVAGPWPAGSTANARAGRARGRRGDRPSAELARRLRDPVALTLDASMLVATVAIVALMVWKP